MIGTVPVLLKTRETEIVSPTSNLSGAAVKVMIRDVNRRVIRQAVEKVGHVDCTSDNYGILEATIAAPLNQSMKRLKNKFVRIGQIEIEGDVPEISFIECPLTLFSGDPRPEKCN